MKAKTVQSTQTAQPHWEPICTRLDAIVLLLLKSVMSDSKGKIILSDAAPVLHLAGYTPTEIASLLGKKKATEVAPYIYSKKK